MFDDFSDPENIAMQVSMPEIETITVEGKRVSPLLINISKTTESDYERDGRVLATILSCSLPPETLKWLAKQILMEEYEEFMKANLQKLAMANEPEPVKKPKKTTKNDTEDSTN